MTGPVRIEVAQAVTLRPYPPSPDGLALYAIGDVHGRDDLLAALLGAIRARPAGGRAKCVIGLGDYVDRGPDSAAVIERLSRLAGSDLAVVTLKGNHEDLMLRFLEDPEEAAPWLANGGDATLASYGIPIGPGWPERFRYAALRDALAAALPAPHRRFFDSLATSHRAGEYLFVHAGIRPGVALPAQDARDLMWIRGTFLQATDDHGVVVVHGHTIAEEPELRLNRIGLDTGAFASGRLSALAVEGERHSLITACGAQSGGRM